MAKTVKGVERLAEGFTFPQYSSHVGVKVVRYIRQVFRDAGVFEHVASERMLKRVEEFLEVVGYQCFGVVMEKCLLDEGLRIPGDIEGLGPFDRPHDRWVEYRAQPWLDDVIARSSLDSVEATKDGEQPVIQRLRAFVFLW